MMLAIRKPDALSLPYPIAAHPIQIAMTAMPARPMYVHQELAATRQSFAMTTTIAQQMPAIRKPVAHSLPFPIVVQAMRNATIMTNALQTHV